MPPSAIDHGGGDELLAAVQATAAAGAGIVKIGFYGTKEDSAAARSLEKARLDGARMFAVLMADRISDFSLLGDLAKAGFIGAMLDTFDKSRGSVTGIMNRARLAEFVAEARRHGLVAGSRGIVAHLRHRGAFRARTRHPGLPRRIVRVGSHRHNRGGARYGGPPLSGRSAQYRDEHLAREGFGMSGKGRTLSGVKATKSAKPAASPRKTPRETLREIGDTIFVKDFVVDCNVGVYAEEQGVTQKVAFTVEARLQPRVHSKDDEIVEVPSYADIIDTIVELARGGHINLVETFAERISEACLADPRIVAVRVKLEKLERGPLRGVEIIRPATKSAAREFGRG